MKVNRHTWRVAAAAATVCVGAAAAFATASPATGQSAAFPKAGVILPSKLAARSAPSGAAKVVRVLPQFRRDFRPTHVLAVAETTDASGLTWLKISLPMRPNGRFGWVRASSVDVRPITREIVIDRGARTLSLLDRGNVLFRTRVAVGKPGAPTPLGNFYVAARYKAKEPWLGAYAFETSAFSKLSDWPGGGIVGIHGTPQPQLLGRAVSHGCIRISNAAALRLKRLAPAGTPIRITA